MRRITAILILTLSGYLLTAGDADAETPIRMGELSLVDAGDYRLGSGDVISVTVDSVDEISLPYTISETGYIVFPTLLSPLEAQEPSLKPLPAYRQLVY